MRSLRNEGQLRKARTLHHVTLFVDADEPTISGRIRQLQREWDLTRVLEAKAAGVALLGVALGLLADRRFLMLSVIASGVLLQHALTGWSAPLPLLQRLGIRSSAEIHKEILALRILRGDFEGPLTYPESLLAVAGRD
jgi:hypothetical protein